MAAVTCIVSGVLMVVWAEQSTAFLGTAQAWITNTLGIAYIWAAVGLVVFMTWLAFSRFGLIKLGAEDDQPDFSTKSWFGMLFTAGVGISLVFWGATEWGFYIDEPPFGDPAWSAAAIDQATSYGMFHWGVAAWAMYALPTVAIAYQFYVKNVPHLRLGIACRGLFGDDFDESLGSRVMDAFYIIALVAGVATSLGLAISLITVSLDEVFGIGRSLRIDITVILGCLALFVISSFRGLKRGIKALSDFNMVLVLGFLAFVLIAGPTLFILAQSTHQLGYMAENFITMLTWTDAVEDTGFVKDWTIFYWAWWLAFAPFIGLFVTRISKGRTIRELILGMLLFGSFGSWVFYMILGNYAVWLDLNGIVPMAELIANDAQDVAIVEMMKQLPFKAVSLSVLSVLCIVFIATSFDSAAMTMAAAASKTMHPDEDPPRWHRVFWSLTLGVMPIVVLLADGGAGVLKALVIIASLPLLVILALMAISLVKSLKEDE